MISEFVNQLFNNPAVQKVIADIDLKNHRAIRCYQKVGFKLVDNIETPDGLALLLEIKKQDWIFQ